MVMVYYSKRIQTKLNRRKWGIGQVPGELYDADPGQQGPCVVAAMNKFTQTTEVLWRSLSEREGPEPCMDRLSLLFWVYYIEDGPHLLCIGSL